jgi:hypothetical protein
LLGDIVNDELLLTVNDAIDDDDDDDDENGGSRGIVDLVESLFLSFRIR